MERQSASAHEHACTKSAVSTWRTRWREHAGNAHADAAPWRELRGRAGSKHSRTRARGKGHLLCGTWVLWGPTRGCHKILLLVLASVSSFCRSSRYGFANRNHLSPILARGPQPRMPPLYQRTAILYYKWETRSHADDPRAEPLPAWRDAPSRGSRLVITAAYVEERLARAREGRRRPGVRDARCCHASGAPVMPAWRHSATHARTGAENRGGCAPPRAERATRLSST